ncbi:hypothetical protein [Kocuria kalidii]|uniref:hypothetical protein n=1 Tax=Kocuria kalidii TaxID=3376283 RepID=UPI00379EE0CC
MLSDFCTPADQDMLDLEPWEHVSLLPDARRDISVVLDDSGDDELVGDRVRTALGQDAGLLESVEDLSLTRGEEPPPRHGQPLIRQM